MSGESAWWRGKLNGDMVAVWKLGGVKYRQGCCVQAGELNDDRDVAFQAGGVEWRHGGCV